MWLLCGSTIPPALLALLDYQSPTNPASRMTFEAGENANSRALAGASYSVPIRVNAHPVTDQA